MNSSTPHHLVITATQLRPDIHAWATTEGWQLHSHPLQTISFNLPPPQQQRFEAALQRWHSQELDVAIFVSPNAVKAVQRALAENSLQPDPLTTLAFAGAHSAALWQWPTTTPQFVTAAHENSADLAHQLLATAQNWRSALLFRAQNGRDYLPRRLRAAGIDTACITCYLRQPQDLNPALFALPGTVWWYIGSSLTLPRFALVCGERRPPLLLPHRRIAENALKHGWQAPDLHLFDPAAGPHPYHPTVF